MQKKEKLVIFGNGELAEVAHYYFTNDSSYEIIAFTVDREYMHENTFMNLPLIPFDTIEKLYPPSEYKMFIAIAYKNLNKLRAEKYRQAKEKGYSLATYTHSKSVISNNVKMGDNCFILENQTIQPFAKIGNDVIIWSGNHIGHHVTIKDHCFITSHVVISGGVIVEPYCFIGVNSTIRDHITIREESLIGMGSIITKDTVKKGVYLGIASKMHSEDSSKINL